MLKQKNISKEFEILHSVCCMWRFKYILSSKFGVQEYLVARARKKKSSLLRNAKIRLSNIHPGRLLMNLRGRDKWIK